MKKPTAETRQAQQIRIVQALKRSLRHKRPARKHSFRPQPGLATLLRREQLDAPEHLSLYPQDVDKTLEFMQSLAQKCSNGQRVVLRLRETTLLTAAAAVYLSSGLDKLIKEHGQKTILIDIQGIPTRTSWFLRESGILLATNGHPRPRAHVLPIFSGIDDEGLEVFLEYLINEAVSGNQLGIENRHEAERLAGEAIKEAMLNVKYHAYPSADYKPWWFTAAILDSDLYIAMCDRGVGIPSTLPRQGWWENLRSRLPVEDDSQMIGAAMKYTRSARSHKGGRGLGTRDMQNLVLGNKRGHMTVISGRGHYRLTGETSQEELSRMSYNVGGTVIQWRIPLVGSGGN